MKGAPDLHVEWVGEEAVVLNEKTSELHYLNPQSALVYALVLEHGMPGALVEVLKRIDGPEHEIRRDVDILIASFFAKGLLMDGPTEQPG